jgi:hypothetical protein
MRLIAPIQKSDLQQSLPDGLDFYITNLKHPSEYLTLPVLPKVHLWCPFNSFNIPPDVQVVTKDYIRKEDQPRHIHITLLQGAGDILHLSPFIQLMKDTYPYATFIHYTYGKFSNLSDLPTYAFEPGVFPNDLMYHQLKGWHGQGIRRLTFHHPPVAKAIQRDCIRWGWDKYDWFQLVSGVRVDNKDLYLEHVDCDHYIEHLPAPVVGIHYLASSMDRTWYDALELVSYFNLVYPNIKFVLFGGEAEQQLGDFPNLLNLAGQLSYRETAGLIPSLDALICVDSVVLHLSKLSQTPTLGLFGWSPASWSGPYPDTTNFIESSDMGTIKMERVIEWLKKILKLR